MENTTDTVKQAERQAELAADTLTGDVRDVMLTHVRSMEIPWSKLSERQQQDKIYAIQKCAETLVRKSVQVVANQGFPHVIVTTGKWAVGETIELKVGAQPTIDNITRLAEHGLGSAVLVLTEVGEFFGQRTEAKAEPDQPSMDLDEDEDGDKPDLSDVTLVSVEGGDPAKQAEIEAKVRAAGGKVASDEEPAKPATRRTRRTIRETEPA